MAFKLDKCCLLTKLQTKMLLTYEATNKKATYLRNYKQESTLKPQKFWGQHQPYACYIDGENTKVSWKVKAWPKVKENPENFNEDSNKILKYKIFELSMKLLLKFAKKKVSIEISLTFKLKNSV